MPTGVVKVFHRSKGYGFIRSETGGEDIFVHRRALEAAGIKHLRKGHRVSFDQGNDLGRPFATNLRLETKGELNGTSVSLPEVQQKSADAAVEKPNEPDTQDKPARKPIGRVDLEQLLADAVRSIGPEYQAFVGVIIERLVTQKPGAVNWAIKGVRYGKTDRDRCEAALGMALREKQLEYVLSDAHEES